MTEVYDKRQQMFAIAANLIEQRKTNKPSIGVFKIKYNDPELLRAFNEAGIELGDNDEQYSFYVKLPEDPDNGSQIIARQSSKGTTENKTSDIAEGSYGKVEVTWLIEKENHVIPVAMKKIKSHKNEEWLNSNEIQFLNQLGQLKGQLLLDDKNYVFTKLITGTSANNEKIKNKSIDYRLLRALDIVSDLSKIHSKHILHRDIKGENILINDNTAEIIDFGFSVFLDEVVAQNKELPANGTPGYFPIELLGLSDNFSFDAMELDDYFKLDIYSLGKTLLKDLGLTNLAIVYRMIDPLYKNRPTLEEVKEKIEYFKDNLAVIHELEQQILQTNNLEEKIILINQLQDKYEVCSNSYYTTLKQVMQEGTSEQLKRMMDNLKFNHLFFGGWNAVDLSNLGNENKNEITELLDICKSNDENGNNFMLTLFKKLMNFLDETELEGGMLLGIFENYQDFLIQAAIELGEYDYLCNSRVQDLIQLDANKMKLLKENHPNFAEFYVSHKRKQMFDIAVDVINTKIAKNELKGENGVYKIRYDDPDLKLAYEEYLNIFENDEQYSFYFTNDSSDLSSVMARHSRQDKSKSKSTELGAGAFGKVEKIWHIDHEKNIKPVAMKKVKYKVNNNALNKEVSFLKSNRQLIRVLVI